MNTRLKELQELKKEIAEDVFLYERRFKLNPCYAVHIHLEDLQKSLDFIDHEIRIAGDL